MGQRPSAPRQARKQRSVALPRSGACSAAAAWERSTSRARAGGAAGRAQGDAAARWRWTTAAQEIFLREIEVTRALRHPNIVELLDFGRHDRPFLLRAGVLRAGAASRRCASRTGGPAVLPGRPAHRRRRAGRPGRARTSRASCTATSSPTTCCSARDGDRAARRLRPREELRAGRPLGHDGDRRGGRHTSTSCRASSSRASARCGPSSDVWSMAATIYFMLTGQYPRDFARTPTRCGHPARRRRAPAAQRDPVPSGRTSPR